ncbi:hypothetical protein [Kitasatospora sp. NPDC094011]|uniref:hypothetical protein n=1 Tax=Kitasatospora sp. NPDC094011 TaxID=3364090 RepID=UPI0038026A38
MDKDQSEDRERSRDRERTATILAVTLASTVSAAVSPGHTGWLRLLLTIAIGATVGLLTRWILYRARLRDHVDAMNQQQ